MAWRLTVRAFVSFLGPSSALETEDHTQFLSLIPAGKGEVTSS